MRPGVVSYTRTQNNGCGILLTAPLSAGPVTVLVKS